MDEMKETVVTTVEDDLKKVEISFDTINNFRLRAPHAVAKGMTILAEGDFENDLKNKVNEAKMMDLIASNVPMVTDSRMIKGKRVDISSPAYNPVYTEAMLKEIEAEYKKLIVERAHELRLKNVKAFLDDFKPTISLGAALYRVSFYLISNPSNLSKSTNLTISFVKKMLLGQANNLLVDSAMLLGGQGKSTVQKGLMQAAERMGFNASMCHLPSLRGGTSEIFVNNELCVDDENNFKDIDFDSLNKVLDKSIITIKGKYIKEWSAKSISNILVGTNYLPTDVNARRYSVRMVDEAFKLIENFGRCEIPGTPGDQYGNSYDDVIEWTTEAWLHLFYYCNKYDLPELEYEEMNFDYGLQYKISEALRQSNQSNCNIRTLIQQMELVEGTTFDYKTKQRLTDQLFMLANRVNLPKTEAHKSVYSVYDWSSLIQLDDTSNDVDTLEMVWGFFNNKERFPVNLD